MIDHAKRLREIHGWLADETDFILVKRAAFEAADEIDRMRDAEANRQELIEAARRVVDRFDNLEPDALRGFDFSDVVALSDALDLVDGKKS